MHVCYECGRLSPTRRCEDCTGPPSTSAPDTAANRATRAAVLDRAQRENGGLCEWCNARPATEWDHRVPRSQGGDDTLDNAVAACRPCNRRRGHRRGALPPKP